MANTTRQSNLFATEDWRKIYESFREIDFRSYDYQTVRRSLINYLQTYYPEDFNDFIESSEYVALIDMIAYVTQSMSFRTDLVARENFLETAERRDSILRLAKMLNYYPKRNQVARGLLKVTSVITTEDLFDSNGNNLQDTEVFWNDTTNPDFLEQFTTIMNAAMVSTQRFGKPAASTTSAGVNVEEYNISIIPETLPVYNFVSTVNNRSFEFEIVDGTYSVNDYLYEKAPGRRNTVNVIYRNDGRGFGSENTGFFFYFKQGRLQSSDFAIDEAIPNRIVNIDVSNIDNNDVWLYKVDSNGDEQTLWTKLPAISGTNVIFNSLSKDVKTLFSVNSRVNDQISLIFGDGVFANIPTGDYRVYYRRGNGLNYSISPNDMQNIEIAIPYVSHVGQLETLRVRLALEQTVNNGTARELLSDVKIKAPQQYYTQNRMVTGEDYQIFPFTNFNNVVKAKAVNRVSSGISRYLDVRDTTGKFSSTNIVASDGILYKESLLQSFEFTFVTNSDIANVISTQIEPIIQNNETRHFYYDNYPFIDVSGLASTWSLSTQTSNSCTGFFNNSSGNPASVGDFTSNNLKFVKQGALLKFTPPAGKVFDINNNLVDDTTSLKNTREYIWGSVVSVVDDGTNQGVGNLEDGTGPVLLSEFVPDGVTLSAIIAPWNTTLPSDIKNIITQNINQYRTFGLRYDVDTQSWKNITALNLDQSDTFDLGNAGDISNSKLDNSWLFRFTNDGTTYTVTYRTTTYVFESELETRFYFDKDLKIFDPRTGKTVKDKINILRVNSQPDSAESLGTDYALNVDDAFRETDGFTLTEKVKVTFPDSDNDGIPDDPEIFDRVVDPTVNPTTKIVFYQQYLDSEGFVRFEPVDSTVINSAYATLAEVNAALSAFSAGQIFYTTSTAKFYQLNVSNTGVKTVAETTDYITKVGRNKLLFQYTHNAPNNRRIDPSPSNIIDMFMLTSQYDTDFRNWVTDITGKVEKPRQPTTNELRDAFGELENYKSVSDAMIFHSVKYRTLFGDKADEELQATFKIIKNQDTFVSDNEIKASVISAINDYFALENWDFGDTFYFSELSAYLHNALAPNVLSIIIVPRSSNSVFGSLLQVTSDRDEIFISSATVNDVEIIDVITAQQIQSSGNVVNDTQTSITRESVSTGGTSTTLSNTTNTLTTNNTTLGGYEY